MWLEKRECLELAQVAKVATATATIAPIAAPNRRRSLTAFRNALKTLRSTCCCTCCTTCCATCGSASALLLEPRACDLKVGVGVGVRVRLKG